MIWNFEAKIFAEVKLGTSLKFGTSAKVSSGQVLRVWRDFNQIDALFDPTCHH